MEKKLNELTDNKILKWLPWVGRYFNDSNNRLLIVGESHYYNPEDQKSIDNHNNIEYTRICINDIGIKKEYKRYQDKRTARLFPNFHKTVFGNDKTNSEVLWQNVAYYNFIQSPMHSNKSRPSTKEIYEGWDSFFEVLKILRPDRVLFIGSEALNKFNVYAKRKDIEFTKFKYHKIADAQISRDFKISFEDRYIKVDSIRHCSSHFSIDKWRGYFKASDFFDFIN